MPQKTVPTEIKKLKGNPGGKRLPKNEPKVRQGEFREAPIDVKAQPHAEDFWNEILPHVISMGTLGASDYGTFGMYCIAAGMHREATIALQHTGLTYESTTDSGGIISRKSPFIEIINSTGKLAQSYANEFGLTPSARAKLGVTIDKAKEDKFDKFIH